MLERELIEALITSIDREELLELASNLIRINSVYDPDSGTSEQDVALEVARWAGHEGFHAEIEEVAPLRPNVIIRYGPRNGSRRLVMEAHTDVVTTGDPASWRYDPFGAEVVGTRLYGRGSNDTKGNLAAMLIAMASIRRLKLPLKGQLIGAVLCDEEGLMIGVQDFIRRGHADGVTGAIICEPQDLRICCTQKGAIRARYLIRGKMSHGAMPLEGLSPIPVLSRLLQAMEDTEVEFLRAVGSHPLLGWPSITPTVLRAPSQGPGQLNVVPDNAEVQVDIRTIPGQSHRQIVRVLEGLADDAKRGAFQSVEVRDRLTGKNRRDEYAVELQIISDRPCTETDIRDPLVLAVDMATRLVTEKEPIYDGVPGATDGTYLWALKGIPIVTIGAGAREVPHQVDEWVDIDQLYQVAQIYALSIAAYLCEEGHP